MVNALYTVAMAAEVLVMRWRHARDVRRALEELEHALAIVENLTKVS